MAQNAPAAPPPPRGQQQWPQVPYAEASYWEARYGRGQPPFEWFLGYGALRRVLRSYLPKRGRPVLQIGCGTSNIQEGMAKAGWTVVNVDIAPNVVERMAEAHRGVPGLSYVVADCRDMRGHFTDCQFGGALDKGTIDALLCCKAGVENVTRMLSEVSRILAPGGVFLAVSLGDPARRLCLLCGERYEWSVQVLLLPKISPDRQAQADGRPVNDATEPISCLGPFEVAGADTVVGLPPELDTSRFFFGYVCRKRRLELPLDREQRRRLPQGWHLASRAAAAKIQQDMELNADVLSRGTRTRSITRPRSLTGSMFPRSPPPGAAGGGAAAAAARGDAGSDAGSVCSEPAAVALDLPAAAVAPTAAPLLSQRTQSVPDLLRVCEAAAARAAGRGDGAAEGAGAAAGRVPNGTGSTAGAGGRRPAAHAAQASAPWGVAPAAAPKVAAEGTHIASGAARRPCPPKPRAPAPCAAVPADARFDDVAAAGSDEAGGSDEGADVGSGGCDGEGAAAAPRAPSCAGDAARARRHSAPPMGAVAQAIVGLVVSEPCVPPEPPVQGSLRLAECDEQTEVAGGAAQQQEQQQQQQEQQQQQQDEDEQERLLPPLAPLEAGGRAPERPAQLEQPQEQQAWRPEGPLPAPQLPPPPC